MNLRNSGETDKAVNPIEPLLSSLGGCMCICAAAFARACKVELRDFYVELEGDLDPDGFLGKSSNVRTGYQGIRYKMFIESPSPRENINKLITMIKDRCPVSDTLAGVDVAGEAVVVESKNVE
mgnify:CR=1 FL=1